MPKIGRIRKGMTLIELILTIALIGIIAIGFVPLFAMSAKSNTKSEIVLDSTYLGKDAMELAYNLSKNIPLEDLKNEMVKRGFIYDSSKDDFELECDDKKYLSMKFKEENSLIRVVVKIFKDKSMNQLEVQYESLYPWIGRGISGGE